jgi:hypothetical protein
MTRLQILFAFLTTLLASAPALAVYSPELGRFRTRDPAGYVDGSHLTSYVRGNPIRAVDPYGLWKLNFSDDVSSEDRKRIQDAVDTACSRVREANKKINSTSECAIKQMERKYGDEWQRARYKLAMLQSQCNSSKTVINVHVHPHPNTNTTRPPLAWTEYKRERQRQSRDDPEYPFEHHVTFNNDTDGPGPISPGSPGNTWHDSPILSPSHLLLHELLHVIENILHETDGDDSGLLDDPMDLENLESGGGDTQLEKAIKEAERCCE